MRKRVEGAVFTLSALYLVLMGGKATTSEYLSAEVACDCPDQVSSRA